MRTKTLKNAKLIIKILSDKNKGTIETISVFDNRNDEYWTKEHIKERGIEWFLSVADMKETLNWNLNGDERTPAMHRTCNPDIARSVKQSLINKWSVNPSKNTHPSAKAHEYESFIIENFLRSL